MKFVSATSILFTLLTAAVAAPTIDLVSSSASNSTSAAPTKATSVPATKVTTVASFATKTLAASATGTAVSVSVSYDETYDNAKDSLSTIACSDGANGMLTKGYKTFGSLPGAPFMGGADMIPAWNSNMCGSCWQLTFGRTSINVLAIDAAGQGPFDVAYAASKLTNGRACWRDGGAVL